LVLTWQATAEGKLRPMVGNECKTIDGFLAQARAQSFQEHAALPRVLLRRTGKELRRVRFMGLKFCGMQFEAFHRGR